MIKHCGNCAVYDRKNMKHSKLCGKCVTEHFPNGKESDPSMWKPLPQTNADRIRAMSDEELADALQKFCIAMVDCSDCPLYDFGCPKNSIFNYWIEWLQQPAEIKKL